MLDLDEGVDCSQVSSYLKWYGGAQSSNCGCLAARVPLLAGRRVSPAALTRVRLRLAIALPICLVSCSFTIIQICI